MAKRKKISLDGPPAVENLYILPDVSEFQALSQFPVSREQAFQLLNENYGSLSRSSVRNMLQSQGIKSSAFKSQFLAPLFKAIGPEGRRKFRDLRKSVFSKHSIQVRNTAEWLTVVDGLAEQSALKRFINNRVDAYLYERELSRKGREFNDSKEMANYLYGMYSDITNISDEVLKGMVGVYNGEVSPDSLLENDLEQLVRFTISARQDFYLALLATQPVATYFNSDVFPLFLAASNDNSNKSMVGSVLEWVRTELRFNTTASFNRFIAAPETEEVAPGTEKYIIESLEEDAKERAKDLVKKWRRSSCNCMCKSLSKCSHRGITLESIDLVCQRLNSRDNRLSEIDMSSIFIYAKVFDNLQAELVRSVLPDDNESRNYTATVKDEFRSNTARFSSYIDRFT